MMGQSERLVRQRLRALSRTFPAARAGDGHSLHQARVATRRLREVIPLVSSGSSRRKLARLLRRVTRAFGRVRELDVALGMLDELSRKTGVPETAITCLRHVVSGERQRVRAAMVKRSARFDIDAFQRKAIAAARRQDDAHPQASVRDRRHLAAAGRRVVRRAERLRETIANAGSIYLADRLHEVRIAVKKLRYALEIWADLRRLRSVAAIRTLKRAQDMLGQMHDMEVLIARTRAIQSSDRGPSLSVSGDLDSLVRGLETRCRQLHGRYTASRSALLAVCDRASSVQVRRRRRTDAA